MLQKYKPAKLFKLIKPQKIPTLENYHQPYGRWIVHPHTPKIKPYKLYMNLTWGTTYM